MKLFAGILLLSITSTLGSPLPRGTPPQAPTDKPVGAASAAEIRRLELATESQKRTVSGVVETLDGKRMSGITIRLTNVGSTTTSGAGEFTIALPLRLEIGDPLAITLLGEDWVVAVPWEGRAFVPTSLSDVIRVRVAHRGDPELLADPNLVRQLVASLTSLLGTRPVSGMGPDQLLAEKAQAIGFSFGQVREAIEEWSKKVQEPYDKGLAALHSQRYEEASRYIQQSLNPSDTELVQKYLCLSAAEYQLGRYPQANATLVKARELQPDNPRVLLKLAQTMDVMAQYADAEEIYQLALTIDERAFGSENSDLANVLNNLALLYHDQGKYDQAEPLYQRALAVDEKVFGPEHPEVAIVINNLAAVYSNEGKYAEAEPLYKKSLAMGEKALGPEHPDVATRLSNLATLYDNEGKNSEAEPLYVRALAIDEKILGPEHPDLAIRLSNLALLYAHQRRYAEAEPLYKRAVAIAERTLGPNHPLLATYLNNLAALYDDQRKYAAAEALYIRALSIDEKALGPEHPDVAKNLGNLALLYDHERRYADAEPLYRRALAIDEKTVGSAHPAFATDLHNLAVLYTDSGRDAEAEPLYERSLAINERVFGPNSADVAGDLKALAVALRHMGRRAEAHLCEQQAAKIQRDINHAAHQTTGHNQP